MYTVDTGKGRVSIRQYSHFCRVEENFEEGYAVVWRVFSEHKGYHKNKNQMSRWQGPLSCTEVGVMDDRQGGLALTSESSGSFKYIR